MLPLHLGPPVGNLCIWLRTTRPPFPKVGLAWEAFGMATDRRIGRLAWHLESLRHHFMEDGTPKVSWQRYLADQRSDRRRAYLWRTVGFTLLAGLLAAAVAGSLYLALQPDWELIGGLLAVTSFAGFIAVKRSLKGSRASFDSAVRHIANLEELAPVWAGLSDTERRRVQRGQDIRAGLQILGKLVSPLADVAIDD